MTALLFVNIGIVVLLLVIIIILLMALKYLNKKGTKARNNREYLKWEE